MSKKVVITVSDYQKNNAGPKAKIDIEDILKKESFESLNLHFNVYSKISKIRYILYDIPHLFKNSHYDEIIFQYPTYSSVLMNSFVQNIRKYTNAKLYFFIHDIESLRKFKDNPEFIKSEFQVLNSADGLIAHNNQMITWLKSNGIKVPIVNLEVFDYLNPQAINTSTNYNQSVCFAGNLSKSKFLNKLNWKNHQLTVFGPNPADNYPAAINYQGQFSPDELPQHLTQNFGLVWDGNSLDTCDGSFGEYMKYNAPHKISLYLSSGIPVIIWKEAAMAKFIEDHHVGLSVDSLNEVENILTNLTPDDYRQIKENTLKVAQKLRSGYYTKQAVFAVENA